MKVNSLATNFPIIKQPVCDISGIKGEQGVMGVPGMIGFKGERGPSGPKGNTGLPGRFLCYDKNALLTIHHVCAF